MSIEGPGRNLRLLTFLIFFAVLLSARIAYLFLADPERFPITTVKIVANYHHTSRKQLEEILTSYLNASFFSLSASQLKKELSKMEWTDKVEVERIWPQTIKLTIVEKVPIAHWNNSLLTDSADIFNVNDQNYAYFLPHLKGPPQQQKDVLQIYKKLSKLLAICNLQATSLELRENQAWELTLSNGIQLQLGKRDIENRLMRFCKAYPGVLAGTSEQVAGVDLRYSHGMAVQWKQPMGR